MEINFFYQSDYLKIQNHEKLAICENENFKIIFSLRESEAISLPLGLFGSFVKKNQTASLSHFQFFWDMTRKELKKKHITHVEIIHPSEIYSGFVELNWLDKIGFSLQFEDINHHIIPKTNSLHYMEKRKLGKLKKIGFSFWKETHETCDTVYDFLNKCRAEKGLDLNIEKSKLVQLLKFFPDRYDIFCGRIDSELVCTAITLKITHEIAYYFLAGTLEKFKKVSPMVGLLHEIVNHYSGEFRYIDLGISSIAGRPQQGLIDFKKHMGGIESRKKQLFIMI